MEYEKQQILCQIEYDFKNDKLISAKTVASSLFAFVDYEKNEFSITQFVTNKTMSDIMNGDVDYEDVVESPYNLMYKGNIVNNINSIEFEEIVLDDSEGTDVLFNNYISKFAFGVDIENLFDKQDMTSNNSFIDAMEYAIRRLEFEVRVSPSNPFEYQYISTWIDYDSMLLFLDKIASAPELANKNTAKSLVSAYRNRLSQRGKGAYTGENSYYNGDNYLKITKVSSDIDAYIVSIVTTDSIVEFCCQYTNGTLISKGNDYINTEFSASKSSNGEYAYIREIITNALVVNVPTEIMVGSELLPVKAIGCDYMPFYSNFHKGIVFNIHSAIEIVNFSSWLDGVKEFVVDSNNQYFKSIDGVLYSKDGTTLVRYPSAKNVTTYTTPNGVTTIEDGAFQGVESLQTLNIASSVVAGIECNNFWASFSMKDVNIASTAYSSHNGAVYNANGTELIFVPHGKTGTFSIKDGTTTINSAAFGYCKNLTKIIVPDSVTTLGDQGRFDFSGLDGLESVVVGANNSALSTDNNGLIYNKNKTILYFVPRNYTGTVVVSNTVTRIEDYAFYDCDNVTEVTIPTSVTNIGFRSFVYCGVKKMTIQGSVAIDDSAFFRSNLEEISIYGLNGVNRYGTHSITWDAFEECDYLTTINYSKTMADWKSHVDHDNYSGPVLPIITVKCSDGNITYTPAN